MTQPGSNKKVANSLVSASFTAVFAVYIAGYVRTQSAAERFTAQVAHRRVPAPNPARTAAAIVETVPAAPMPAPEAHPAARKAVPIPVAKPKPAATHIPDGPQVSTVEIPLPPEPVANALAVPVPPAPIAPPVPVAPPAPTWKDGTHTGWGYSRHGNIEASVVIEAGRILSATISQCRTRYSCDVIEKLPPEVAQRQSPDVDYVSGATQSADAFYGAVVQALSKAK